MSYGDQRMSIPMVELRLKSMEQSIIAAFSDQALQWDQMVRDAVKRVCTKEAVQDQIERDARRAIEDAIHNEVSHYFTYGEGRKAIAAAVIKKLQREVKDA